MARLQDRQVDGLGALENVASIDADLTIRVREVGSVESGMFHQAHTNSGTVMKRLLIFSLLGPPMAVLFIALLSLVTTGQTIAPMEGLLLLPYFYVLGPITNGSEERRDKLIFDYIDAKDRAKD
jgi:hypothetical protein